MIALASCRSWKITVLCYQAEEPEEQQEDLFENNKVRYHSLGSRVSSKDALDRQGDQARQARTLQGANPDSKPHTVVTVLPYPMKREIVAAIISCPLIPLVPGWIQSGAEGGRAKSPVRAWGLS